MTATILLVDDEEMLRQVMTRALEAYGFRVIAASDGQAAWELLQANEQAIPPSSRTCGCPGWTVKN
jgi:CheY-like chemotaxis protein